MATPEWLRYANQGATRNQPLNPSLVDAFGRFLPNMGVTAEVFSGGQPTAAEGGPRTGSVRHDHGEAGDVFFYKNGRKLDWANPQDLPIFQDIVRQGKAAGLTGFGAGPGYMQPGSMHVGFGHPGVWGAGGSSRNAPSWLVDAFGGAPAGKPVPTYDSLMTASSPAPPAAGGAPAPTSIAGMFAQPVTPSAFPDAGGAAVAPQQTLGNIALLFAQQQAQRQQQKQDDQEAEQLKRQALFSADSLAGLFGAA